MRKHEIEAHEGRTADFGAKVTHTNRDCMSRQIREGIGMRRSMQPILNSKTEWGSSTDPMLVPPEIPLRKSLMRGQTNNQQAGNTEKRVRVHTGRGEEELPHRLAKRGRRDEVQTDKPVLIHTRTQHM